MYSGKSNYSDDQLAREMLWMCDSVVLLCQVSIDMQITENSNNNNKPTFETECYNKALCNNHSRWNVTGDQLKDNASF